MNYKICYIMIGCLLFLSNMVWAENEATILILPFQSRDDGCSQNIAREITWMVKNKLELNSFNSIYYNEIVKMNSDTRYSSTEIDKIYKNLLELADEHPEFKSIDWIIGGEVKGLGISSNEKIEGARFIGFRRYPVTIDIRLVLYYLPEKSEKLNITETALFFIPRFNFCGFHSNPFPSSPRTIDSLIHDAVIRIMRKVSQEIKNIIDS